jgi:hypothetical protein
VRGSSGGEERAAQIGIDGLYVTRARCVWALGRRQRYRGEKQNDHHDDCEHDGEGEYERGCTAGQRQCGPSQHFH